MVHKKHTILQSLYSSWHKGFKKEKAEQGFTLIELLLVIGIIAILAAIVIIAINPTKQLGDARTRVTQKQAREMQSAITQHIITHGAAPAGITTTPQVLCAEGFVPTDGNCDVALFSPVPSGVNSLQEFVVYDRAANAVALGLPEQDSGYRVSTDGMRYFVEPLPESSTLVANTFSLHYGGTANEGFNTVINTSDGGYIASGYSNSTDGDLPSVNGNTDALLAKFDSDGVLEWQNSYGGSSSDSLVDLLQTSDGGYIAAGSTYSIDGDISGNNGDFDGWVVKLNSTGIIEWSTAYGGSVGDQFYAIRPALDGGYIITGATDSTDGDVTDNDGGNDAWVVKLNSTGVIEWSSTYGGSAGDSFRFVELTPDGGYIAFGFTSSTDGDVTDNDNVWDLWVVKLSSTGVIEWENTYGGSISETPRGIIVTPDGGYIFAADTLAFSSGTHGDISNHIGFSDIWLVKIDSTGVIEWDQNLGGTSTDRGASITQTTDSGYIIAGQTYSTIGSIVSKGNSDGYLAKVSSTGVIEWQNTFGGSAFEYLAYATSTPDGGYIISGGSNSGDQDLPGNYGNDDAWLLKVDANGDL